MFPYKLLENLITLFCKHCTACTPYFITVYEPKKEIHNWKTAAEILLKQIASLFSTLKQFPFMAGAFYFPSSVPLPSRRLLFRETKCYTR